MMTSPADSNLDVNALFQTLVKEAATTSDTAPNTDTTTTTTSNAADAQYDLAFFDKLAANDAGAQAQLNEFVSKALDAGHSEDEIAKLVDEMENEARGTKTASTETTTEGDPAATTEDQPNNENVDAFAVAQAEAENEGIEKAIDDELEHNPLAKTAGVTREVLEGFLLGEAKGEAYAAGRMAVADMVDKIAALTIPNDELVEEAIKVAKEQGLDVSAIEAEIAQIKTAATADAPATESAAAKTAREIAQAEQNVAESLVVLKCAGFDVDALVKQAEEKKKMSGGKKALVAGAAGLGALGAGALGYKHRAMLGAKAKGAGEAAKNMYGSVKSKMSKAPEAK